MTRGIYTIASGGVAALARLDAASQNLANAGTAGYKAERAAFVLEPLSGGPRAGVDPILGQTGAQVQQLGTMRDFSQGPIRMTGNPLDVAVSGSGFFVVQTPRGERYTRQGSFQRDPEGFLVTPVGDRVQGENGDIRLGDGDVVIAEDGTVTVDDQAAGRLRLVDFGDKPRLVPEGGTLFAPVPGATGRPIPAVETHVVPSAIEGANVDAVHGLVELVDLARGFESYMRALQRLDEVTQHSIDDVGRVG